MADIVVTWPKGRTLESYLAELRKAHELGQRINFRVSRLPSKPILRCFVVYDGDVVGYNRVIDCRWLPAGTVRDPISGDEWPPGYYIIRDPRWRGIDPPIPYKGFQGWRYFDPGRLV